MARFVNDTFDRSVTDGWGSADTGGAWTQASGVATELQVNGTVGRQIVTAIGTRRIQRLASVSQLDFDMTCKMRLTATPTGSTTLQYFLWRYTDLSNHMRGGLSWATDGSVHTTVERFVGSVNTSILAFTSTLTGVASGAWVWLRIQQTGSDIRLKAWKDGDPEPGSWTRTAVDSSPYNVAGAFGFQIWQNTGNTNTPEAQYDSLTADDFAVAPQLAALYEDITIPAGWRTDTGATTNLFATTDEEIAGDTDFIETPVAAAASEYKGRLRKRDGGTLEKPVTGTDVTLRVRADKDVAGGDAIKLEAKLYQSNGTTQIGATKTLSASVADDPTTYTVTWAAADIDGVAAGEFTTGLVLGLVATKV